MYAERARRLAAGGGAGGVDSVQVMCQSELVIGLRREVKNCAGGQGFAAFLNGNERGYSDRFVYSAIYMKRASTVEMPLDTQREPCGGG